MSRWVVDSIVDSFEELQECLLRRRGLDFSSLDNKIHPVSLIKNFDLSLHENIKAARNLVLESISQNLPIVIHGDYDADGVCATSILVKAIHDYLGYQNVTCVIPDRFEDGYGLSDSTMNKILNQNGSNRFLLITVDSGITSVSQVSRLKELGNLVIVTDHHQQSGILPPADVIVWSDKVVGSSLAWFLSLALGEKSAQTMSLAGIATITDVFPLTGFNRVLVKESLDTMRKNPPSFVSLLYQKLDKDFQEINVYDYGFIIGPRLNSSGRIQSANLSLNLLLEKERSKLENYLDEINSLNSTRQSMTQAAFQDISNQVELRKNFIFYYSPNLHEGIIGLVASKLVQNYHLPAFVLSKNEGLIKGSVRSIKGVNVVDILKHTKEFLKNFGGHSMAGGFSLQEENLSQVEENISEYFDTYLSNFSFEKEIEIDSEIDPGLVTFELINFLSKLEPYGNGNSEPIFLMKEVVIYEFKKIGSLFQHLSLIITKKNYRFKVVDFNTTFSDADLYLGAKVDIVFKVRKNIFNDKINIDLHLVDLKLHAL